MSTGIAGRVVWPAIRRDLSIFPAEFGYVG
jgi:hypothetical protein